MKLSLPQRFPPAYILAFAGAVFLAAWAEGTELPVAALAGTFLLTTGFAFNLAGGLVYPSGAYIFALGMFAAGAGMVAKIAMGEPLDTHLRDAQQTMLVYNGGMLAVFAAAFANRHLRRKRPLLQRVMTQHRTKQVAMGCILIGIGVPLLLPESAQTTFGQINNFLPLAVMLLVFDRAKKTDGEATFSWIALSACLYQTIVFGLLTFSKQSIFSSTVAWILAAGAAGYHIGKARLVFLIVLLVGASAILTPYAQLGRFYRGDPDLIVHAIYLLEHPVETRELYELQSKLHQMKSKANIGWFDEPQGLLDREVMVAIDDALIYVTDHGHTQTLYVLATDFMNVVPHVFFPDKPNPNWGNQFAHELGLVGKNDHNTGISFSPFADAYHEGQWPVIFGITPFLYLMLFFISDSVAGRADENVWALLYILYFLHTAPDGLLNTTVYGSGTFTFGVIASALLISWLAPLVGQLVTLPEAGAPQTDSARS